MSRLKKLAAVNADVLNLQDSQLGEYIEQSIIDNITEQDILNYCDNYAFSPERLSDPTARWYLDLFKSKNLAQDVFTKLKTNLNLQNELDIETSSHINAKANVLDTLIDITNLSNYFAPILEKLNENYRAKTPSYAHSRLRKLVKK